MNGQKLFERFARNAISQGVRQHTPLDHVTRHQDPHIAPQWYQLSEEMKRTWELTAAGINPTVYSDFEVMQVQQRMAHSA